jgi:putative transposase
MSNPFRYFKTSPEIIRLAMLMHAGLAQPLCNIEHLLQDQDINIHHETVRNGSSLFQPPMAPKIEPRRILR